MNVIMIIIAVVAVIGSFFLTWIIAEGEFDHITPLARVPFPLLCVVIAIDGSFFITMFDDLKNDSFTGDIQSFLISEYILIGALALMIVFVILSAIISGKSGFLLALVCMAVYLIATVCVTCLLAFIIVAVVKIAGLYIIGVCLVLALIGFILRGGR